VIFVSLCPLPRGSTRYFFLAAFEIDVIDIHLTVSSHERSDASIINFTSKLSWSSRRRPLLRVYTHVKTDAYITYSRTRTLHYIPTRDCSRGWVYACHNTRAISEV